LRALGLALLAPALLAVLTSPAGAEPSGRTLVLRRGSHAAAARAATQTAAELAAAGFDVRRRSPARAGEPPAVHASRTESVAVVQIAQERGRLVADVWVALRDEGRSEAHRLEVRGLGREDARVLSLRVLEALYASSPELRALRRAEPEEGEPRASEAGASADELSREVERARPLVGLGPALLYAGPRLPASVGLLASGRLGVTRLASVEVGLVALFPSSIARRSSSADVEHQMAWARLRYALLGAENRLVPELFAGLGAHRLAGVGRAERPYEGRRQSSVSLAGGVGAGLHLRLSRHLALGADVQAFLSAPRPVLVFEDDEDAAFGRPSVLGALYLAFVP
jgi:hypothetical protein